MPRVRPPANLPAVIHARLKPRWEWQPKQGRFATKTREVPARQRLAEGTEISHLVERLQKVSSDELSAADKKLARWVQFRLPTHVDIDAELREIRSWPCVAEAHIVPPPSLPGPMMSGYRS
ncbi:MAG TPA: hypothetical protein VHC22_30715 [Pirellulales bacterium]|nr:hypothetical protein [Pirellulales bacterium]